MRQLIKNRSKLNQTVANQPVFTGILTLVLFVTLFIIPAHVATAGTSTEETPQPQYRIYLPMTLRETPARYVSLQGNDSYPGTFTKPWRTIGKAASMVKPGETVYIRGGIYNEVVHFKISGTSSSPIKITAYPDENPVIDGGNTIPGPGGALLWIEGDNIYISGLEVRNSAYGGILVRGNYDVVDNMYIHHSASYGALINQGRYSVIENSRVWRNSLANEYGRGGSWGQGLSASRDGVSYATIRHNTVWENWGEGISTFEADHTVIEDNVVHDNFSANIYISDATNVLSQRNFLYTDPNSYVFPYGSHGGIMMGDEVYNPPSANITVINNISFGNHGNFSWWQGVQGGGMNNVLIANNTFVNAYADSGEGRGNITISGGDHQNVRFENNLIQQDGNLPVIATGPQPGIAFSHNLWSKTPYPAASGPGDVIGDPLFAKLGNPYMPVWFTLTGVSSAINNAISLSEVNVDYFGLIRDAPPDIGANEFFPSP